MEVLGSVVLFVFSFLATCAAQDTITVDQAIRDGEILVSTNEMYELGFFSPAGSRNRFLGIWYNKVSPQTVVWVANRENPITDSSGVFKVDTNGSLLVIAGTSVLWSSNTSIISPTTIIPVAQLLSTGNLVVRGNDDEVFVWQSFDYPTDTFLPGMKYGKDLVSRLDRRYTSWKSVDDPSPGQYVGFLDTEGFPQIFEKNGSLPHSRMGPWNGVTFNGLPNRVTNSIFTHEFVFNDKEAYYMYAPVNSSVVTRIYINTEGNFLRLIWNDKTQKWTPYWHADTSLCNLYGVCGPYGKCIANNSPICSCMEGFEPQNPAKWNASEWSSGCRRRTPLDCPNGDGFQVIKNIKLPDTRRAWYNRSMTLGECANACKRNCSCAAYANIEITRGGSGCLMWSGDLMDVRTLDESQDLYVRMATSDLKVLLESSSESSSNKRRRIILASVSILSSLVIGILFLATLYAWSKKKRSPVKKQDEHERSQPSDKEYSMEIYRDDTELTYFSLIRISKSTNDFSDDNKVGEGGFGPVYKGVLEDGREIAVKRLSKASRQGLHEFKNELAFIAKLQHRNLVKLLGYCNQGDESMLIYEYMPNKSLDLFIFEKYRSSILDWPKRFHIIQGIARGLLYLHQDSRFKIVHRDLKAGNILLDADLNPKISDFGLARMFREHENEANTSRVVGTLGYISPEYAVEGTFSEKSDVFSFGVIVLEIVSGRKNRGFSHEKDSDNLLAHAWRLYEEGSPQELFSEHAHASCVESEILQSIHIGLLCVQHHAKDRPTMSSVILMFDQDGALPRPKQPAFFAKDSVPRDHSISVNDVTVTTLEPR